MRSVVAALCSGVMRRWSGAVPLTARRRWRAGVSRCGRAAALTTFVAALREGRSTAPSYAPIASAILPGSGQFSRKQESRDHRMPPSKPLPGGSSRGMLRNDRPRSMRTFKDLARRVARAHLSPSGPDGDWTYYEMMRDFLESGQYSKSDTRPGAGGRYRRRSTAINGCSRSRTNPDSASAIVRYEQRAYKPDMLWSWRNAQLQYDLFKRATETRNDAHYAAAQLDLIVLAPITF